VALSTPKRIALRWGEGAHRRASRSTARTGLAAVGQFLRKCPVPPHAEQHLLSFLPAAPGPLVWEIAATPWMENAHAWSTARATSAVLGALGAHGVRAEVGKGARPRRRKRQTSA